VRQVVQVFVMRLSYSRRVFPTRCATR